VIPAGADWHTHSDLTDGADPWEAMAGAAREAGLTLLGASDHVRRDSTWLPEYAARVRRLAGDGLAISCGVEAKVLDTTGALDLPDRLPRLDHVLVADHQLPGPHGPLHPRDVAAARAAGTTTDDDVLDHLVTATCAALGRSPAPPVIAHLFSVLPKCGMGEAAVTDEHLRALADACRAADAAVEVNEKWRSPGPDVLARLSRLGVRLVSGSDAHRADEVGRRAYLDEVAPASARRGSTHPARGKWQV
jgi:putative hydrolase